MKFLYNNWLKSSKIFFKGLVNRNHNFNIHIYIYMCMIYIFININNDAGETLLFLTTKIFLV